MSDAYEQLDVVYPVKRAVVLVCKAWNDMATEYLYEHIICRDSEKMAPMSRLAVLKDRAKGEQLGRMVIRVDMLSSSVHQRLHSTLLRLCPNLQSIYTHDRVFDYPYPYSHRRRNLPTLSIVSELLQTSEYQLFWSMADHWHSLTIYFDMDELNRDLGIPIPQTNILRSPPNSGGKEFINLKHIYIMSKGDSKYSIRNLKHWPLPSVTHLTINSYIPGIEGAYDDVLDVLRSSQLGLQLKFFALLVHVETPSHETTVCDSLELLKAMPNVEEITLPFFWDSVQPPNTTITFPKVRTMGMEMISFDNEEKAVATYAENALGTYTETCCRLFPNIQTIKITSIHSTYTVDYFLTTRVGPMIHLKEVAALLKGRGIKFEDCAGWDIVQVLS